MDNTNDNSGSLTDKIRTWFERSPKAQRAYERLSADLDAVVERVDEATSGLREKVGPIIDPPRQQTPPPASNPAMPESESSIPPGVKKDGEPLDPTS